MTKAAVSNITYVDFRAKKLQSRKTASDFYVEGCTLDEDHTTYTDAIRCYEACLLLDPNHLGARVNLGNVLFRFGSIAKATKAYKAVLKIDRWHPEANYNYGYMLSLLGKHQLAIRHFLYSLESNPDFADAYYNIGCSYKVVGKTKLAIKAFVTYLRMDADSEWAERARASLLDFGVGVLPND